MARTKKADAVTVEPGASAPDNAGVVFTPEEIQAVLAARKKLAEQAFQETPGVTNGDSGTIPMASVKDLAQALVMAIEQTRPPQKKTPFNKKNGNPFWPKDGSARAKLKRTWHQHGREIDVDNLFNEEIELLNQVKPGIYVNGIVKVIKRKDRGYDITWPVRTAAQRLRLSNEVGAEGLVPILKRCIEEHNDPRKFKGPDDGDDE